MNFCLFYGSKLLYHIIDDLRINWISLVSSLLKTHRSKILSLFFEGLNSLHLNSFLPTSFLAYVQNKGLFKVLGKKKYWNFSSTLMCNVCIICEALLSCLIIYIILHKITFKKNCFDSAMHQILVWSCGLVTDTAIKAFIEETLHSLIGDVLIQFSYEKWN